MKILIAEDEATSYTLIKEFLSPYGHCDVVKDGQAALEAFQAAHQQKDPYDLICMDIMMPRLDGQEALKAIRKEESHLGIRGADRVHVVMITALEDQQNVIKAFYKGGAEGYIVKPLRKQKLLAELTKLGIIEKV